MVDVDVVVVGAGLAGLTAADALVAEGYEVAVLEARDRVGGRTAGGRLNNGVPVELGGQWVGPTQTKVHALVRMLGLETFLVPDEGAGVMLRDGTRTTFRDDSWGLSRSVSAEVARLHILIDDLAATVSLSSPWQTARAQELDRQTVDAWLSDNSSDQEATQFWRMMVSALFSAEATELSLLHFLFYIKSGGMLDSLINTSGGAQESRVMGGSHQIAERMAAKLGSAVRLRSVASSIVQDTEGAEVRFGSDTLRCRRVVVAVPATLAARLRYEPALPADRDILTQQIPMGSVIKFHAAYDTPFWRVDGLSGLAMSFDHRVSNTMDNSPPTGECGVLVGFFEGAQARVAARLSSPDRRALAIDDLVRFFGPGAANPLDYVEQDWMSEEFSRGCYGGRLGAGVWTQHGEALARPCGRIHWAGAESSDVWNGYMEGAIRSGERAAAEIMANLS